MSPVWPAVTLAAGAFAALLFSPLAVRSQRQLIRPNYRGTPLPVSLGIALNFAGLIGLTGMLPVIFRSGPVPEWPVLAVVMVGAWLLFGVGGLDDRREQGPRGLTGHIGSLLRGHPTTGILKLAVGVAAAVSIALAMGGGVLRVTVAAAVIALAVNVTNALDVRPGRALKWALLILIPTTATVWRDGVALVLASYTGASLGILPFDLREKGMLGDAGSNPLGLMAGSALAATLPLAGLLAGLVVLAGLQVAAETVTISRLIEAVPPLRWFDRLGRRN